MPRLKKSLEHAARAAEGRFIDTDDLLLGLTEVRGTLATHVLHRLGITGDAVRAALERARRQAS